MRFTRCDACGAKALMAASQCPKCSHWLGLRDDQGETVPLARCRSCQCYYPRKQGGCKWCGTPQRASRASALVWGGLSVVLIAGVAWGATRAFGESKSSLESPAPARTSAIASSAATPADTPHPDPIPPPVPSPMSLPVTPASAVPTSTATPAAPVPNVPAPDARPLPQQPTPLVSVSQASVSQASVSQNRLAPPDAEPSVDTVRPMPGDEGTARTWVNVRAATGKAAEVLGVLTPDTRVRFGEARGAWIQIKTASLSGWVDRRLFSIVR